MAVSGLDEFARYFAGYEDCYTIIGGAACEILMSQTPIDFRATKDVDMIILFEDKFKEFAELFWKIMSVKGSIRMAGKIAMSLTFTDLQILKVDILSR